MDKVRPVWDLVNRLASIASIDQRLIFGATCKSLEIKRTKWLRTALKRQDSLRCVRIQAHGTIVVILHISMTLSGADGFTLLSKSPRGTVRNVGPVYDMKL